MTRLVSLLCPDCDQRFGGQETRTRHRYIAGDRYRCRTPGEMLSRGFYADRWGVWHREANPGQTSLLPPTETDREPYPASLVDEDLARLFDKADGDPEGARMEAEVAIVKVERGASATWLRLAVEALKGLAQRHPELTGEDVWGVLERAEIDPPREPRAMGAVFTQARIQGWIVPTRRYRQGTRRVSHSRPERIWESRLWGDGR